MPSSNLTALIFNAALLLAMAVLFDIGAGRLAATRIAARTMQLFTGAMLGAIGIAIMTIPLEFAAGIQFDTRSVLLAIAGLFFGVIPTLCAMGLTAIYRLWVGGDGALTGVAIIVSSGSIGLLCRSLFAGRLSEMGWRELGMLGLIVHVVMLLLLLTLPWPSALDVLHVLTVPALTLYPLATAALGLVFSNRARLVRLAQALEESELRYRTLFQDSHIPLVLLNPESLRCVDCNQAAAELLGYPSRDTVIGLHVKDVSAPLQADGSASASCAREYVARCLREGEARFQWRHRRPDDSLWDAEVHLKNFSIDGRVLLQLSLRDITREMHDQTEINKLRQAIEQSPDSIMITDVQGFIEYVNEASERSTGYRREDLLGRKPALIKSGKTPPETYRNLWEHLARGETWRGELINRRKNGEEYVEFATIAPVLDSNERVSNFLAIKQDITGQRLAEARVRLLEHYDLLTGLPNRTLLLDRLAQTLSSGLRMHDQDILILLNIDRFKLINDARGHEAGDMLLQAVGNRLKQQLRDGDTVARLAADDFAILLPHVNHGDVRASRHALSVAEKIIASLREPLDLPEEVSGITVSLGITTYPEGPDDTPTRVLRRADTALHRAKAAGGNQSAFFEVEMGQAAKRSFRMEQELHQGIETGELRLYLQSQVLADGSLAGVEALVRWQHPVEGLLLPGAFIAIAEQSDLIVELGRWVLAESCRLIAAETAAGRPLRISVNISPRHFRQPGFVRWVESLLTRTGADPLQLSLEITEGLVIDNIDDVVAKMSALAALGIHFSVDDFGTGYSSLAYLKRLPIHELKIDRTFIQDAPNDPDDAALVETIISVASHMHLQVVAEGVETPQQADFLNARGAIIHQGYLFGRPEPAQSWLTRWHAQPKPTTPPPRLPPES